MGTTYDANHVDKTYARLDGGTDNPGYFAVPPDYQAYACYTPSNTTLTFYYDNLRSSRTGTTYDLNTGSNQPGWYTDGTYSSVTKVVFNSLFSSVRPTTTHDWFFNMGNLQSITGINYLNTSEVTTMNGMFNHCSSLTSLDVSNFNTSKVIDMDDMFRSCSCLTSLNLSSFNTSNVTRMAFMFDGCSGLTSLDLSSFNTSNVTSMAYMFASCSGLTSLDLCGFNTANVTNMWRMFDGCQKLTTLDLSSFNTSNVKEMGFMFRSCCCLTSLDLSGFNTAKVQSMGDMFYNCYGLTTIYAGNGWSTVAVIGSAEHMFRYCHNLVGGKGTTYDENHVDAAYAHIDGGPDNPGYLTADAEAYACYTPSDSTLTFYYDKSRSSHTNTYDLNTGNSSPDWSSIRTKVTKVVFNSSFASARPTTTFYWFSGMSKLRSITGMPYLNTANVTNMSSMFSNCYKLTSIDLSHFNTTNVTSMSFMFSCCYGLTSLDLSSFNTASVTSMREMFNECSGLTSLDLSSFNTASVTNMLYMFYGCSGLMTIYVGNEWSTAAVTSSVGMFKNCSSIKGGKGTTYDASHVDATYAHVDGGPSNPGYFTARFLLGDVNGDGHINVADVTALIAAILNSTPLNPAVADINGDTQINVADVTALIQVILNQ